MKRYIIIALLIIAFCAGSFYAGKQYGIHSVLLTADTVIVRDTITVDHPVPVRVYQDGIVAVRIPAVPQTSLPLPDPDTVRIYERDSIYITLPRERRIYETRDYYAAVSGVSPSLDTISVYPIKQIVTRTVKQSPVERLYIDAHYTYDTASHLPVTLNWAYHWQSLTFYGGAGTDILQKCIVARAGVQWTMADW